MWFNYKYAPSCLCTAIVCASVVLSVLDCSSSSYLFPLIQLGSKCNFPLPVHAPPITNCFSSDFPWQLLTLSDRMVHPSSTIGLSSKHLLHTSSSIARSHSVAVCFTHFMPFVHVYRWNLFFYLFRVEEKIYLNISFYRNLKSLRSSDMMEKSLKMSLPASTRVSNPCGDTFHASFSLALVRRCFVFVSIKLVPWIINYLKRFVAL